MLLRLLDHDLELLRYAPDQPAQVAQAVQPVAAPLDTTAWHIPGRGEEVWLGEMLYTVIQVRRQYGMDPLTGQMTLTSVDVQVRELMPQPPSPLSFGE